MHPPPLACTPKNKAMKGPARAVVQHEGLGKREFYMGGWDMLGFQSRGLQLVRCCCWFVVLSFNHSSPFLVIKEDPNTTSPFPLSTTYPLHTPTQLVAGNYSFLAIVQLIIRYTIRFATLFS